LHQQILICQLLLLYFINLQSALTSSTNDASKRELYDRIEQISRTAQGRVEVAATVLETGESVALNGEQQFPMQSVYKFPIGMAVLAQVDQGKLKLEQRVRVEKGDFVSKLQHSPIRDDNPQGESAFITPFSSSGVFSPLHPALRPPAFPKIKG
jgi:beta-lactamase class A